MRSLITLSLFAFVILAFTLGDTAPSNARSWCAQELVAHEWGVHVFSDGGTTRSTSPTSIPSHFHNAPSERDLGYARPVNTLPADSGDRLLPVLQFYVSGSAVDVPVGVEVGFTHGTPSVWYPQLNPIDGVRSPATRMRQLEWPRLLLSSAPAHTPATTNVSWVNELRAIPDAAWVNNTVESERFVFYEGNTTETPAIRIRRGPTYATGHRHLILQNTSAHTIHNVFFVLNEGSNRFVFEAPAIPAGATSGFVVEEHPVQSSAATRAAIRSTLVDPANIAIAQARYDSDNCVMMRNPATPFTVSRGHSLYPREADTLMNAWGARFADAPGATIVYREDAALLDAEMPLSVFTNMYHFVTMHRASLAVMEHIAVP